jgi:hypothetical protein
MTTKGGCKIALLSRKKIYVKIIENKKKVKYKNNKKKNRK